MKPQNEAGKPRVMISGGSRGLGLAIARAMQPTHRVLTFARSAAPGAPIDGITYIGGIDATKTADVDKLMPHLGDTDCLVNNLALGNGQVLPLQPFEMIEQLIQVNLVSVLRLTRLYIQQRLLVRKGGAVVTIGSIAGERGFPGLVTYGATKGAIVAMTRALAQEFSGKNFRFNVVVPGYMKTEMSSALPEADVERIIRRTPLRRLATVDDVVPAVVFLLSDGGRFINGQCVVVDGGFLA